MNKIQLTSRKPHRGGVLDEEKKRNRRLSEKRSS